MFHYPKAYDGVEPYIFISYAHKDSALVLPMIDGLQKRGFRVWYDAGTEAATEWPEFIGEHLAKRSCVIAFITEAALKSKHCRREISMAADMEINPLVIYLEEVELTFGMRLQRGNLHAMYYLRHPSLESFLDTLAEAKLLQTCRDVNFGSITKTGDVDSIQDLPAPVDASLSPESCNATGDEYYFKKDYANAVRWYRGAADRGYAEAQFNLGICYANGYGVAKNDTTASAWYRKAAEQGHVDSQHNLAVRYENGRGLPKDYDQAVYWYRKAAEQGSLKSMTGLGYCYSHGQGVTKDLEEAIRWYRKAAEQGHATAQFNLAVQYANGSGVPKDDEQADYWYRKAAQQGNASAQ